MSRVGKRIINLPAGVEVLVNGTEVTVKGPNGTEVVSVRPEIAVKVEDNNIILSKVLVSIFFIEWIIQLFALSVAYSILNFFLLSSSISFSAFILSTFNTNSTLENTDFFPFVTAWKEDCSHSGISLI